MNTRSDAFVRKFSSAQGYIGGASLHDIVSLKYRDANVPSSNYFELFHDCFGKTSNLTADQIQGDFQGRAWLVAYEDRSTAILVEHETGLELLYVAGSIASLLSLIPLIGTAWQYVRHGFRRRPFDLDHGQLGLEIRTLNKKNKVIEKHFVNVGDYVLSEYKKEITALKKRIHQLERQISSESKSKVKSKTPLRRLKKGKK